MFVDGALTEIGFAIFMFAGAFAVFAGWLFLPLMPFLVMAALYVAIRYGLPALGRAGTRLLRETAHDAHHLVDRTRASTRELGVHALV